jgi:hypothetical protein
VHKILASKYICENGKKKREKEKEKEFSSQLGRGGFLAQQAPARAGGRAFGPPNPAARGDDGGNGVAARARMPERGGENGVNGTEGGARARPGPVGGEFRGGSPLSVRFCDGGRGPVAEHGWLMGITGVGRISPAGAYGGRSAARWRVPAAVKPPVRFPVTVEWGKWRVVNVRVWRTSWHNLIEQKIAREGEGSSPER